MVPVRRQRARRVQGSELGGGSGERQRLNVLIERPPAGAGGIGTACYTEGSARFAAAMPARHAQACACWSWQPHPTTSYHSEGWPSSARRRTEHGAAEVARRRHGPRPNDGYGQEPRPSGGVRHKANATSAAVGTTWRLGRRGTRIDPLTLHGRDGCPAIAARRPAAVTCRAQEVENLPARTSFSHRARRFRDGRSGHAGGSSNRSNESVLARARAFVMQLTHVGQASPGRAR